MRRRHGGTVTSSQGLQLAQGRQSNQKDAKEGLTAVLPNFPADLGKVIATATKTVRAASSAEPRTAKELSSRQTTIAARTSATAGTAVARKNILAGRTKATATVIRIVLVISSVGRTTVPGEQLLRTVTTAA